MPVDIYALVMPLHSVHVRKTDLPLRGWPRRVATWHLLLTTCGLIISFSLTTDHFTPYSSRRITTYGSWLIPPPRHTYTATSLSLRHFVRARTECISGTISLLTSFFQIQILICVPTLQVGCEFRMWMKPGNRIVPDGLKRGQGQRPWSRSGRKWRRPRRKTVEVK